MKHLYIYLIAVILFMANYNISIAQNQLPLSDDSLKLLFPIETYRAANLVDNWIGNANIVTHIPKSSIVYLFGNSMGSNFWAYYEGYRGYLNRSALLENPKFDQLLANIEKSERERVQKQRLEVLTKKYDKIDAERIIRKQYWIGMTADMARESLGSPKTINRSTFANRVNEQWVYENGLYLYFEGNKLVSFQSRH